MGRGSNRVLVQPGAAAGARYGVNRTKKPVPDLRGLGVRELLVLLLEPDALELLDITLG